MRYAEGAVVIEAVQFPYSDSYPRETMDFLGSHGTYDAIDDVIYIRTLEGMMRAKRGDMIIKGVRGEFYPCDLLNFEETYRVDE
jgi:hypothetical protein